MWHIHTQAQGSSESHDGSSTATLRKHKGYHAHTRLPLTIVKRTFQRTTHNANRYIYVGIGDERPNDVDRGGRASGKPLGHLNHHGTTAVHFFGQDVPA